MSAQLRISFTMLLMLIPFFGIAQPQTRQLAWYVPVEADFRPEYNSDTANQQRQTWNDYFGWVRTFYEGSAFTSGWTAQGKNVISGVRSTVAQQDLVFKLNYLGKKVSREWSKDNGVRKIDTADLNRWGRALSVAKSKDTGSGDNIKIAMIDINAQVNRKLGISKK